MRYKILLFAGIIVSVSVAVFVLLNMAFDLEKRKALENIQITLVDITLNNIGLTGVKLDVSLSMYNPNDVTATLDRSEYELWFNDNYLGKGTISKQTDIPPYTSKTVNTDFDLSYLKAGEAIVSALGKEHTWKIKGVAHYNSILGTLDIPFDIVR